MFRTLSCLLFLVILTGTVFAEGSFGAGDNFTNKYDYDAVKVIAQRQIRVNGDDAAIIWMDDRKLASFFVNVEDSGIKLATKCKGIADAFTQLYGSLQFEQTRRIGNSAARQSYSYEQAYYAYVQMQRQFSPNDMRKFLLIRSEPIVKTLGSGKALAGVLINSLEDENFKEFDFGWLYDGDKYYQSFDSGEVKFTNRYNELISAVYTGDSKKAYKIVSSVQDEEVSKAQHEFVAILIAGHKKHDKGFSVPE